MANNRTFFYSFRHSSPQKSINVSSTQFVCMTGQNPLNSSLWNGLKIQLIPFDGFDCELPFRNDHSHRINPGAKSRGIFQIAVIKANGMASGTWLFQFK